jgi:hypothetical protein
MHTNTYTLQSLNIRVLKYASTISKISYKYYCLLVLLKVVSINVYGSALWVGLGWEE